MDTKTRAKKASRELRRKLKPMATPKRGPVTIYLDSELFKAFKSECEGLSTSASQVIEELVREFMAEGK